MWICGHSIVHWAHKRAGRMAAGSQLGFRAEVSHIQKRHAVGSTHCTSALADRPGLGADSICMDRARRKVGHQDIQ